MKEIKNKTLRSGRNVYRIMAESAHHNTDNVKMSYQSGRHAADNAELGTWKVHSLNGATEVYGTFEEAAQAFEDRTNAEAPKPNFKDEPRQPGKALEDAEEHLGHTITALQDAGWTNKELETVEKLKEKVREQK